MFSYIRNGYCVVTIKTTKVGMRSSTEAWLMVRGKPWAREKGAFKYYAGPVRQAASTSCVAFAGGHDGVNWTSGWVGSCGVTTPRPDSRSLQVARAARLMSMTLNNFTSVRNSGKYGVDRDFDWSADGCSVPN